MKTLLITDLHFTDKPPGLLTAQKDCILTILRTEKYDDVIIMGDLMMNRKPSPSVLLALKEVVDCASSKGSVTIIRGNHDSENKSDDGVTALSLFEKPTTQDSLPDPRNRGHRVKIVTKTWYDHRTNRAFIPHNENDDNIKMDLSAVPIGYTVFGHFGYRGALNSAGDGDFDLRLSDFRNTSFLGHVHGFVQKKNVTVLGTPYTTNFGEVNKQSYYAILEGTRVTFKPLTHGPRHLIFPAKRLEDNLEFINDPSWYTMLRVTVDADHHPIPYDKLKVPHLDVKYTPVFNEEDLSSYEPDRDLFSINEMIIEDYVDGANSTIPKETLMNGYRSLKDED